MSSIIRPVGPEDPQTYWKRRAVLVGIAVVVLLVLWMVFKPSGSDGGTSAEPTPTPSPTSSSTATASPSPSGSCADSDIKVTATSAQAVYPAGANPQITLSITNTGDTACSRNVGSDDNEIEIKSGSARVWSSDDCTTDDEPDVETLQPGARASVTVEWTGELSAPGCPTGQPQAKPGSYQATARNGKVKSEPTTFELQ